MSLIESKFVEKTSGMEAYRVLVNFWSCIKIHVPNILSCVSQVFPHYTKHDVSHSYAILDSIERVLGKEAIDKLSVTDLWLLLCTAFYHDIGMYISGDEVQECFESKEFQKYLCDLKDDAKLPLNKFANCFAIKDGKLNYDNCELSLDSYNAARYLLADFFRVNHADRSKEFLQTDPSVAQMFSEIKRLITTIAEICRLHGEAFQEVMKCNDVENGVNGIEDYCHPRFVACMLRLGDLLDFDSSRISRFSLNHLSSSIPSDSKIHNEKNYCIKHALITPEKVDVFAECKEVEVAFEIDKWFTLIREEMFNQRNSWHDIVADLDIKGFPMCGKLETKLLDYEKIDNDLKAKFEIEGDNAIKILQGSGLYDNKFQCIREILQNAVDATYLRIYLEKLKEKKEFTPKSIDGFDEFLEICKQPEYQIEIRCRKKENEEKTETTEGENKDKKKKYVWHFEIQDHGIGIRKEDLRFLLKIGSGKNNKDKFDIIKKMPEYAKPSGIFGIGFQSIFLITDEVNIKSRYALCDEVIDMTIGTPLKDGFALLKTEKNPFAEKGTIISFDIIENLVDANKFGSDHYSYYETFKKSYDFIENEKSDVEIASILAKVYEVGENSYLNFISQEEEIKKDESEEVRYRKIYHDDKSGLIVELFLEGEKKLSINDEYFYSANIDVFYRNEKVRNHNLSSSIHFVKLNINILSGCSDEILSVSRNDLKNEYENKIKEPLKKLIIRWIDDYWDLFDDEEKRSASLFMEYYGETEEDEKKEWWKKNKICGISFGKDDISFEKKKKYKSIVMRQNRFGWPSAEGSEETNKKVIECRFFSARDQFLGYVLKKYGYNMHFNAHKTFRIRKKEKIYYEDVEIEFNKDSEPSVEWEKWLFFYRRRVYRTLMPCFQYENLQVKEDAYEAKDVDPMHVFEKISYPRTVCPYVVKDGRLEWDCSDKVIKWVRENNIKDKVTEDEIIKEYEKMKKDFEKIVKKINLDVEKQKVKEKKDLEAKNAPKPKKQVEKKAKAKAALKPQKQVEKKSASKVKPKTIKPTKNK